MMFETPGTIGIEMLPGDGRTEWERVRAMTILRREEAPQSGPYPDFNGLRPQYTPPGHPRTRRPPMPYSPPRQTRVTASPALEEVRYRLGPSPGADAAAISKEYQFATLPLQGRTMLEVKASGTVTWDTRLNMPRQSELKGTMTQSGGGPGFRLNYTFTSQFAQKDAGQAGIPPSPPVSSGVQPSSPLPSGVRPSSPGGLGVGVPLPSTPGAGSFSPSTPEVAVPRTSPPSRRRLPSDGGDALPAPSSKGLDMLESDEPGAKPEAKSKPGR